MYNALCELLVQGRYGKAGLLFIFVLTIVMIFLSGGYDFIMGLYKHKRSRLTVVLSTVVLLAIFLIVLLGPDIYKLIAGVNYAHILPGFY